MTPHRRSCWCMAGGRTHRVGTAKCQRCGSAAITPGGRQLEDLTTDCEYVSAFLKTIPEPVVLVGHSYGGSVITNATVDNTNAKALVYVDAAAPAVCETNGALSGIRCSNRTQKPNSSNMMRDPGAHPGATDLYLKRYVFLHYFGNDLPTEKATKLWATQRAASTSAFETPSKFAGWETFPPATSSAAVTRPSRRHRNTPWPTAQGRTPRSSTGARTSP